MANPSMIVKIAANLDSLKATLAAGGKDVELVTKKLEQMTGAIDGKKLEANANLMTLAVEKAGGAATLTDTQARRVYTTVSQVIDKYAALGKEAPPHLIALAEATKRPAVETEGLSSKLVAVGAFIGTMAANAVLALGRLAVDGIKAVVSGIGDLVARGAQIAGISTAFGNLTGAVGTTAATMLGAMRTATKGLVTDIDLMAAANKALLLGLPVTDASMGQLANAALVLGRAMKQDAQKSFDDLITALGRSSPMILDNLGLTVKVGEANEAYAKKLGIAADKLTDQQKKLAFYDAAMEAARLKVAAMGDVQLTLGDRLTVIKNRWTNFTDALAVAIAQSPVLNALFAALGDGMTAAFGTNQIGLVQTLIGWVNKIAIGLISVGQVGVSFGSGLVTVFSAVRLPLDAIAAAFLTVSGTIAGGVARILELAAAVPGVGRGFDASAVAARNAATAMQQQAAAAQANTKAAWEGVTGQSAAQQMLGKVGAALADMKAKMIAASQSQADATAIAAGLTARQAALATTTGTTTSAVTAAASSFTSLGGAMRDGSVTIDRMTTQAIPQFRAQVLTVLPSVAQMEAAFQRTNVTAGTFMQGYIDGLKRLPAEALPVVVSFGSTLTANLKGVGAGLSTTFVNAFTGGGGLSGAFTAVAVQIGDAFGKSLTTSMTAGAKGVGGALGSVLGGLVPVVGGLIGPLIGMIGSLFTKESMKVNDLRDAFIGAQGGLGALNEKAKLAGLTLDALLKAKTVKDYEAAVKSLETAMASYNTKLALQKDLQVKIEGILGQIALKQASLVPSWDQVSAAAGRYGGTIDTLGPKIQQLAQNASAQQIIDDWDVMTRAGADLGGKIDLMAPAVSRFVQASREFGTTVPENMRPMLQAMLDAGALVDENGERLSGLGDIRFGDAVKSQGDLIKEAIDALNATLTTLTEQLANLWQPAEDSARRIGDVFRDPPWDDWQQPHWPDPDDEGGTAPSEASRAPALPGGATQHKAQQELYALAAAYQSAELRAGQLSRTERDLIDQWSVAGGAAGQIADALNTSQQAVQYYTRRQEDAARASARWADKQRELREEIDDLRDSLADESLSRSIRQATDELNRAGDVAGVAERAADAIRSAQFDVERAQVNAQLRATIDEGRIAELMLRLNSIDFAEKVSDLQVSLDESLNRLGVAPRQYEDAYAQAMVGINAQRDRELEALDQQMQAEADNYASLYAALGDSYDAAMEVANNDDVAAKYELMRQAVEGRFDDEISALGQIPSAYEAAYDEAYRLVLRQFELMRKQIELESGAPVPPLDAEEPAYASGTHGQYVDFGAGTPVILHGRERVMTESEGRTSGGSLNTTALEAKLDQLLVLLPSATARAVRDAVLLAG